MKLTKLTLIVLALLCLLLPIASATCTYATDTLDSTDYLGVNTAVYNETTMATTQLWTGWDFFTPRLNITRPITETLVAGTTGVTTQSNWRLWGGTCIATMQLKNGSTVVDPSNYTFLWINQGSGIWAINMTTDTWATNSLTMSCNRTFTKNKDDLTNPATTIKTGTLRADWLDENTPSDYGDSKLFKLDSTGGYGALVNVSNWAVGWKYTEATCTAETSCQSPINSLIYNILAGIFMLGMLVFIVFSLMNGADFKVIVGTTVAALIMLVALAIINSLIQAMCVVPAP